MGEWDVPQLEALLKVTLNGHAEIDAYEMDLVRKGRETRRLVLNAQRLVYFQTPFSVVMMAGHAAMLSEPAGSYNRGRSLSDVSIR